MNTNTIIHKGLILSHRQCAKRAWLEHKGEVQPTYSFSDAAVLEQGQQVHAMGRTLYLGAERVNGGLGFDVAADITRGLIDGGTKTIMDASFIAFGLGVRVDVLEQGASGLKITEIKTGSTVKDLYLDDCAIQCAAIQDSGFKVESVELMLADTSVERPVGGTGAEVLAKTDVSEIVFYRAGEVSKWFDAAFETVAGDCPDVAPGKQCSEPNPCPFAGHCGKPVVNEDVDQIAFLPSKSVKHVKKAIAAGATTISQLPVEILEHPRNILMHAAITRNGPVIVDAFARELAAMPYPRSYLDFEAASFAIPRFDGMRAFQAIPFQWSCHQIESAGADVTHGEFLDCTGDDPREQFARTLIAMLGTSGPVFVYSAYEKSRIKELAVAYPDMKDALEAIVERLVDLLSMARRGFYHPLMRGSWSLKKIVPVLPKTDGDTNYDDLGDVAEGLAAQAAYMEQIDKTIIGVDKAARRAEMLKYCATDTEGLVRFVKYIEGALTSASNAQGTNQNLALAA